MIFDKIFFKVLKIRLVLIKVVGAVGAMGAVGTMGGVGAVGVVGMVGVGGMGGGGGGGGGGGVGGSPPPATQISSSRLAIPMRGQAKKEMGGANRTGDLWEWWEFSKRLGVLGKGFENRDKKLCQRRSR